MVWVVWQFVWEGTQGGCLFEEGAFHWLSGRFEVHTSQQPSTVLWSSAARQGHSFCLTLKAEWWPLIWEQRQQLWLGGLHHLHQWWPMLLHRWNWWRDCSANLRLQEASRPFSLGKDRWQTCLQKVCPGGGPTQHMAQWQDMVKRLCLPQEGWEGVR